MSIFQYLIFAHSARGHRRTKYGITALMKFNFEIKNLATVTTVDDFQIANFVEIVKFPELVYQKSLHSLS